MILNLTQHPASPEQLAAGVVDLPAAQLAALKIGLTFCSLPSELDIIDRAEHVAAIACHNGLGGDDGDDPHPPRAMIGGALWLMAPLADALRDVGIEPVFAFSVRETEEQKQADGSVRKIAVFRHAGFVPTV